MNPEELQDELAELTKWLVDGERMQDTAGNEAPVNVYKQNIPWRTGTDTGAGADRPEPYVLIALAGGQRKTGADLYETVNVVVTALVGNTERDRQGHRDALHLLRKLYLSLTEHPVVAGKWRYQGDIQWALDDSDNTAAAAAMLLTFDHLAEDPVIPDDLWG